MSSPSKKDSSKRDLMEDSGIASMNNSYSQDNSKDTKEDQALAEDLCQLSLNSRDVLEYFEPDEDGDIQLHLAIASGFVEVAFALIRLAPHPDYLSLQNQHALYAPLHVAVLQNQPQLVRRLVIAGARLDVRDGEGNTPLHLAARRGNVECGEAILTPVSVQEMREAQVPLVTQLPVDVIDLCNANGEHCVHLAAMGGHIGFLRFLCWNNADMNAPDGKGGRSALHLAVGAGNLAVIQCLLEPRPLGCGVDPCQRDWYGRAAYHLAMDNDPSGQICGLMSALDPRCADAPAQLFFPDTSESEVEVEVNQGPALLNSNA